jgi:hypothetical protein
MQQMLGQDAETAPWGTRVRNPEAMALISVDAVLEKLATVFSKQKPNSRLRAFP